MREEIIDVRLPEFVFLTSPELDGRNVVMHVRTVTAVEFFHARDFVPTAGTTVVPFSRLDKLSGRMVEWLCVLHFSPLLDTGDDNEEIRKVMHKAVMWFCDRLDDSSIFSSEN